MSERPNGTRLVALAEELGLPAPTLASDRPMWAKHAWVLALENDEAHKAELAAAIAKSLDEGSHRKFIHEVALDLRCANVVSRVYSAEFVRICEYAERDWPIDAIVANAEVISSNVCYFALSPLGCSPVEFTDRAGHVRIGPDPKKIEPRHVDAPTLWVLSQISPDLMPSGPPT